jgi:drug/metabolite transporter (DMT)-like permease
MRLPAHAMFAAVGLIWGSNFLFMKWASATISPGQTTLLRVLSGFVPVALYAASRGALSRRHLRYVHHFLVMSVLATSLHYFALAAGSELLPSGIAGALTGVIPLLSLLGAAVLLRSEPITPTRVLGLLVGCGGVLLIARPWEAAGAVSMAGVLYILVASLSFALAFVYARRFLVDLDIPPAGLTTYQLGLGLLALAAVTDLRGITAIGSDPRALTGLVVGLGLLGTGVAYIIYYLLVERLGAITASSATYVPPVVALAIGWLLVGEPIRALDGAALLLILVGVLGAARRPEAAAMPPPARPAGRALRAAAAPAPPARTPAAQSAGSA